MRLWWCSTLRNPYYTTCKLQRCTSAWSVVVVMQTLYLFHAIISNCENNPEAFHLRVLARRLNPVQAKRSTQDFRAGAAVTTDCVRVPGYLVQWQGFIGLLIALYMATFLVVETSLRYIVANWVFARNTALPANVYCPCIMRAARRHGDVLYVVRRPFRVPHARQRIRATCRPRTPPD